MVKDLSGGSRLLRKPEREEVSAVQLLTIAGLLEKTQRTEHPDYEPDAGCKKAKKRAEQRKLI